MFLRNCTSSHELDANALFVTFTHRKNRYDIKARVTSAIYYSELSKRSHLQLVYELLRHVRTCQDWMQKHPIQWTTTTIPIWILLKQTSYVVNFLRHHYFNMWTALLICPVMLWFVVLCCLKKLCICHIIGPIIILHFVIMILCIAFSYVL